MRSTTLGVCGDAAWASGAPLSASLQRFLRCHPPPRQRQKGPSQNGPFKRTPGSFKRPRSPSKGPRSPLKGPRGPLKGPRDPVKGPRGPFKGPRRGLMRPRRAAAAKVPAENHLRKKDPAGLKKGTQKGHKNHIFFGPAGLFFGPAGLKKAGRA